MKTSPRHLGESISLALLFTFASLGVVLLVLFSNRLF